MNHLCCLLIYDSKVLDSELHLTEMSLQIPALVEGAVGGAIAPAQLSVYIPFQI